MKTKDNLLEKYYRGETTEEEELALKSEFLSSDLETVEKDIFGYFRNEAKIPDGLEDSVFESIREKEEKRKSRRVWIYSVTSVAASILLIISIFTGIQAERKQKMENDFFVLEEALFRISESIQPEEQNEMLVLWVDENVEIIVN
jgi:succinate dehydrogenase flavin-adding protein (antitoxin of CptAB toxin-antitoxin module)